MSNTIREIRFGRVNSEPKFANMMRTIAFLAVTLLLLSGCATAPPVDSSSSATSDTVVPQLTNTASAQSESHPAQGTASLEPGMVTVAAGQASAVAPPRGEFRFLAGDQLQIFVWRNPELSVDVKIRPDGKINAPLISELEASGKSTDALARDITKALEEYVKNPVVTFMVKEVGEAHKQQIRVIGAGAGKPQGFAYSEGMTVLDVLIAMNGLSEYAAGNRASLVREVDGKRTHIALLLDNLLRQGDVAQNIKVYPGDILVVPESRF